MKTLTKRQQGFTIIELMIATTIFSLVLMICLAAIMSITRMYYQGTLQARTQNKVREIVDEVADELRYRPGDFITISGISTLDDEIERDVDPTKPKDYIGQYCIGNIRYRYLLGFKTEDKATVAITGEDDRNAARPLTREKVSSDCGNDDDFDEHDEVVVELIESEQENNMLDENMRITEFDISRIEDSSNYRVAVTVVYGDDDLIGYENNRFICKPDNVARAYCATSRLEVIVSRRI